ncbi:hypothetical protein CLF_102958 [Clonorchis sinensis]|uniref:Uncharacterized protein n=1 Tax=Clonorchis sinensis TaxID=79923 RepID=G7Y8V6_CLOSI|nr:hypothetical protein CLF_102958 [Clonorchis sinensis]
MLCSFYPRKNPVVGVRQIADGITTHRSDADTDQTCSSYNPNKDVVSLTRACKGDDHVLSLSDAIHTGTLEYSRNDKNNNYTLYIGANSKLSNLLRPVYEKSPVVVTGVLPNKAQDFVTVSKLFMIVSTCYIGRKAMPNNP